MSNVFTEVLKEAGHVVSSRLDSVILFITSTCQQRCFSCFYWDELNQKNNMTHEQLLKMADTSPPFRSLLLSGGEPFLRPRLAEVLDRFAEKAKIQYLAIPTNGGYPDKVEEEMTAFLTKHPDIFLTISVSIDGFEKSHEKIRGVPRAWELALKTLEVLRRMRERFSNMRVNVTTVACTDNFEELEDFIEFVDKELGVDFHILEYIRGEPKDPRLLLGKEPAEKYIALKEELADRYFNRRKGNRLYPGPNEAISRYYMAGFELVQREIKKRVLLNDQGWPFPCLAGQTMVVVDHDGSVRACELRDRVTNLKEFEYDFSRTLASSQVAKEVDQIAVDRCDKECIHGCFVDTSQKHSFSNIAFRIPWLKTRQSLGFL